MKTMLAALLFIAAPAVHAEINCTASYRELIPEKPSVPEFVTLVETATNPFEVQLKGTLHGRTFVLSGNLGTNDFLLSQVWGAEYTNGVNTSGTFRTNGHMALSTVSDALTPEGKFAGSIVFRVECIKK
jgi:hypothetical protein